MTVLIIENPEDIPAPPGDLKFFEGKDLISRFGYKAVEIDGSWFWEAGTENDYRSSEAERLGINKADVDIKVTCYQTSPNSCGGYCGSGFCRLMYQPMNQFYYCGCTG